MGMNGFNLFVCEYDAEENRKAKAESFLIIIARTPQNTFTDKYLVKDEEEA